MTKYFTIASFVIFQTTFSQVVDSAFGYVPLQVGNSWTYDYQSLSLNPPGHLYYYSQTITGDTTAPNGFKYFVVVRTNLTDKTTSTSFQRIDSATINLYQYGGSNSNSETLEDSLRSMPGDHFGVTTCTSLQADTVLGLSTVVKSFSYSVTARHQLAYGLGRISDWVDDEGFPYGSTLIYARINNKEFGTPLLVESNSLKPNEFSLSQNFPNPFNPTTSIRFSLAKAEFVTLRVSNVLGQYISTLISETKQPGNYLVSFNGEKYSSGVYYYTLTTEDHSISKSMILLK